MERLLSGITRVYRALVRDAPLASNPLAGRMSQQKTLDSLLDGISEELVKLKSYGVKVPELKIMGKKVVLLDHALSFYSFAVLEGLARTYTGTTERTGETIPHLFPYSFSNSGLHALFYAKAITRVYEQQHRGGEGHINSQYGQSINRQQIFVGFTKVARLTQEIKTILEKGPEEKFDGDKDRYRDEIGNVVNYFCTFLKDKYLEVRETLKEDRTYHGAEKREIDHFNFMLGKMTDDLRVAFGYSSATSGTQQEETPRQRINWGRASNKLEQLFMDINEDILDKNYARVRTTLARSLRQEVANFLVYARFLEAAASHYRSLVRIPDYK